MRGEGRVGLRLGVKSQPGASYQPWELESAQKQVVSGSNSLLFLCSELLALVPKSGRGKGVPVPNTGTHSACQKTEGGRGSPRTRRMAPILQEKGVRGKQTTLEGTHI